MHANIATRGSRAHEGDITPARRRLISAQEILEDESSSDERGRGAGLGFSSTESSAPTEAWSGENELRKHRKSRGATSDTDLDEPQRDGEVRYFSCYAVADPGRPTWGVYYKWEEVRAIGAVHYQGFHSEHAAREWLEAEGTLSTAPDSFRKGKPAHVWDIRSKRVTSDAVATPEAGPGAAWTTVNQSNRAEPPAAPARQKAGRLHPAENGKSKNKKRRARAPRSKIEGPRRMQKGNFAYYAVAKAKTGETGVYTDWNAVRHMRAQTMKGFADLEKARAWLDQELAKGTRGPREAKEAEKPKAKAAQKPTIRDRSAQPVRSAKPRGELPDQHLSGAVAEQPEPVETSSTSTSAELRVPTWVREHHARVVKQLTSDEGTDVGWSESDDGPPDAGDDKPDVEVEDITEAEARGLPHTPPPSGTDLDFTQPPSPLGWVDSQLDAENERVGERTAPSFTGPRESPAPPKVATPQRRSPGPEVGGSVKEAARDLKTFDERHHMTLEQEVQKLRRELENTRSSARKEADKNRRDMEALVKRLTAEHVQALADKGQTAPFPYVCEVPSSIRPSSFPSESTSSHGSDSLRARRASERPTSSDERKEAEVSTSAGGASRSDSDEDTAGATAGRGVRPPRGKRTDRPQRPQCPEGARQPAGDGTAGRCTATRRRRHGRR